MTNVPALYIIVSDSVSLTLLDVPTLLLRRALELDAGALTAAAFFSGFFAFAVSAAVLFVYFGAAFTGLFDRAGAFSVAS